MDAVLGKMERDALGVRTPELSRDIRRLELSLRKIVYALVFLALLTNGVQLHLGGEVLFSRALFVGAVLTLVGLFLARLKRR